MLSNAAMAQTSPPLPIDAVLDDICDSLAGAGALVVQAEPGAGKTTRVPAALLERGLAAGGAVMVLEPRRVAARAAADFVAAERGEPLGEKVGYQVRFERRGGAATQLWFVTEGIALRRLAGDPFLDEVGVVVIDEFHERHLAADAVLAVADELRRTVRPELKIAVMSATLDTARVAEHLGGCPVIRCPGTVHPVAVEYRPPSPHQRSWQAAAAAVLELAPRTDGDILVFLPGIGEIRRTAEELAAAGIERLRRVLVLHGDLPLDEQRRVLQRSDEKRVILATNVAESSVTVDGVTAVVDSGLARIADFDAARGVDRLRLRPISLASADQRAGRAGRQGPGSCLRLWSRHDHAGRRRSELPEIRRLDLVGMALELRAWGLQQPQALRWLDAPPPGALAAADELLRTLGAVDAAGGVTAIGRQMIRLPAPPRPARLLLEAARLGAVSDGALLAAFLAEREIWTGARPAARGLTTAARPPVPAGRSDLLWRADLFAAARRAGFTATACRALDVDRAAARAVERAAAQLQRAADVPVDRKLDVCDALLRATTVAFADRLARRRAGGDQRALMAGRAGVRLSEQSCVRDAELFVAVEVRGVGERGRTEGEVTIASAVEETWLREYFPGEIVVRDGLEFDESAQRAVSLRREEFRGVLLREVRTPTRGGAGSAVLLPRVLAEPSRFLQLTARDRELLARIEFARRHGCIDPALDPMEMLRRVAEAACAGADTMAEVRRVDCAALLAGLMSYDQRRQLDRDAPATFRLPSGRDAAIDYARPAGPAVAARIQELFGLSASPRIAGGAVSVAVEILGPNQRPVQLTSDLESFWTVTYPEIRRELRGRYPKHDWPEDPSTAQPSSRVRPRRRE